MTTDARRSFVQLQHYLGTFRSSASSIAVHNVDIGVRNMKRANGLPMMTWRTAGRPGDGGGLGIGRFDPSLPASSGDTRRGGGVTDRSTRYR